MPTNMSKYDHLQSVGESVAKDKPPRESLGDRIDSATQRGSQVEHVSGQPQRPVDRGVYQSGGRAAEERDWVEDQEDRTAEDDQGENGHQSEGGHPAQHSARP